MASGTIKPIGIDDTKKGLQAFQFDHGDVHDWCLAASPIPRQGMTIYEVAATLNMKHEVVAKLIESGIIRLLAEPTTWLKNIDPASVHTFYDTYVATAKIAPSLNTSPTKLPGVRDKCGGPSFR